MLRPTRARILAALLVLGLGVGLGLASRTPKAVTVSSEPPPVTQAAARAPVAAWRERIPALVVAGPGAPDVLGAKASARLQGASRVRAVAAAPDLVLENGAAVTLPLFDGRVAEGVVTLIREQAGGRRLVGGTLAGGGHFAIARGPEGVSAMVYPVGHEHVYRLTTGDDGGGVLAEVPRGNVLCASLPPAPKQGGTAKTDSVASAATGGAVAPQAVTVTVPLLESRPEAEPVFYLDFDGATVVDPNWRAQPIVAAASGLSAADITRVWRRVAEDYRPFRINVTTDPALYAAARPMQRMRCIITTSSAWYGNVGGVAGLFSWREAGVETNTDDMPCWAFSDQNTLADDIALAVSHEGGHTLGLSHDGLKNASGVKTDEYYAGHGAAVAWGPIMGAPYGQEVIQWNAGDYASGVKVANNTEDDVAIIASVANHTGFAAERRAATLAEAGRLSVAGDGVTVDHRGLIETGGAESWLLVAAGAGPVNLALAEDVAGDPDTVNFDGSLTLATTGGVTLVTVNTAGTRFPQLSTTVAAGVYVLRVRSVGEGSPVAGGYSAYGSIGRFRVTGTVAAPSGVAPLIGGGARVEGRVGDAFVYQIEAAGAGLSYGASGMPSGLAVTPDGRVEGVPTEGGVFAVTVSATNGQGTSARVVTFAIAGISLAGALDAPSLSFTSGGDRPWRTVAEADAPTGGSAARSGEVLDDYQTSWIETALTGPGRLKWRWKVSSEADYDFFHARLDGASVASISGEMTWSEQTLTVPAGAHVMRWIFEKDPYLAVGTDSAWLDDVRWARGFELWAEAAGLLPEQSGAGMDPDGDGVVNLLEYAFDRAPAVADGLGGAVTVAPSNDPGAAGALEVAFDRPAGRDDLRYTVEVSSDLLTWSQGHSYGLDAVNGAGLPTQEVSRTPLAGGAERIVVRDTAGAGAPARFMRVRVQR